MAAQAPLAPTTEVPQCLSIAEAADEVPAQVPLRFTPTRVGKTQPPVFATR